MTVTDLWQERADKRGRNLAVAIFTAATLVPAVAAITIIAILNAGSDDGAPSPAAEDAYITQVAEHMDIIERDRQAFIDAGRGMCGITDEHAEAGTRQILVDHGLSDYAIQWELVATAATAHLC